MKFKLRSGKVIEIYFADVTFWFIVSYVAFVLGTINYTVRSWVLGVWSASMIAVLGFIYFRIFRPVEIRKARQRRGRK